MAVALVCCSPKVKESTMQLPTMGWSSWNTYRVNISDSLIMSQADAMVSTGLADAGYNHINIDGGIFTTSDNFFWLAPGESKEITINVKSNSPIGKVPTKVMVTSWNSKTITIPI